MKRNSSVCFTQIIGSCTLDIISGISSLIIANINIIKTYYKISSYTETAMGYNINSQKVKNTDYLKALEKYSFENLKKFYFQNF